MATAGLTAEAATVRGLPVLGNAPQFARDAKDFLLRTHATHGDAITFNVAGTRFYSFNTPAAALEILRDTEGRFDKASLDFLEVVAKRSMLIRDGESWRLRRATFRPSLSPGIATAQGQVMADAAEAVATRWLARAGGAPFDAAEDLLDLTIDVGSSHLFGPDNLAERRRVLHQVAEAMPVFVDRNLSMPFLPHRLPLPWNRAMRAAMRELDVLIDDEIATSEQTARPGADVLAHTTERGHPLTAVELRDELAGLLNAAFESSFGSLCWIVDLLARNGQWQDAIADEVAALKGDAPLESADLRSLDVSRRVVEEMLRLYPAFPIVPRHAPRTTEVQGVTIEGGSNVVVSLWSIQRRADLWPDPERFDPDRFLEDAAREIPAGAYFPFGEGARNCVGRHLALASTVLYTATIFRRLRVVTDTDQPPLAAVGIPIRPRGGVTVRVERRS